MNWRERASVAGLSASMELARARLVRPRRRFWSVVAVLAVACGAAALWSSRPTEADALESLARDLGGPFPLAVDAFWSCALHGEEVRDFGAGGGVAREIHRRATQARSAYGAHVEARCMGSLASAEAALGRAEVVPVFAEEQRSLSARVQALQAAWRALIAHLAALDDRYDEGRAASLVDAVCAQGAEIEAARRRLVREVRSRGAQAAGFSAP